MGVICVIVCLAIGHLIHTFSIMRFKLYTDGGARGNPGPAAIGIYLCHLDGEVVLEHGETIGVATNNVAEYRALIEGLKRARDLDAKSLECFLDSELVVKQLQGEYQIKNFQLQKLFDEVRRAEVSFEYVSYTHLPRENENMRRADQLVNYALDYEQGRA